MGLKFSHNEQQGSDRYNQLPDEELISLYILEKNPEIIVEILKRYSHLVYGICLKYLKQAARAEDATMEILEGLMDNLPEQEIRNFPAWLYQVSKNYCLMIIRKKTDLLVPDYSLLNNKKVGLFMEMEMEVHHKEKEDLLLEKLEDGLKQLKKEQGRCVSLFYLEGKSYQEVAELTGLSLKEVKSHIQNGKRNLKIYMTENGKTNK